ncbi:MAG: glycosyl hydrolase [Ignavibacteriaceae bacterium]|nr:glycosyl hydrolase [Ignavibacteriaceae bacterium]
MQKTIILTISAILLINSALFFAQNSKSSPDSLKDISLAGLKFRSIGPALTGGRVIDIAVNLQDHSEYFIASGSGSLWKTSNNGITFSPVFENQKTFAIGSVSIDPTNPNIVWAGTGENSNHYNVAYGDGIYKSEDGGESWKNMGIKTSEHIGGIAIDPINSNQVYVAAMGSLRKEGGDRGIFKTTDGGKTWSNVLFISKYTGCYEVHMDPRFPNILYAVADQRMRNLYTGINGGPESGIYRTTDYGATWDKMKNGLPTEDVGRIGMSVSPVNPNILYAIVEAKKEQGVYKSSDRGVSWTKQSSYVSAYTFYFQKLFCDTKEVDRIYSMDVFLKISNDGGKTWANLGEKNKHVDNHVLWIDPDNNLHLISGCDGGVYETYDQGKNWDFKSNIPIAEVYKVTTDNLSPFYNVYIGTQDNNSLGGPSRTINSSGITNQDWVFTLAGDGFQTQVDWKDPNIIYAESQDGGLNRVNKISGERLDIKPYDLIDTAYRFDWDAALLISEHNNNRLYFGCNKLFRTDDQGNSWKLISPDLTLGVPLNFQKLMGRSWSVDELANKSSMAQISSIAESPLDDNIIYTGSGDGLICYTTDGGNTWTKSASIPGLPEYSRIHQIIASRFNKLVAYAACHDFSGGDYNPYLYKTIDGGKTWFSINANLPATGSTYTVAEDHVDADLLFVGTQFGIFYSNSGGNEWIPLKTGLPTMEVMNLTIQRRENDLVVSTFGRGVYILDDYTPLRQLSKETLQKDAFIFPIKDAPMYIPAAPFGFNGIAFMGARFFTAPNPEVGAVFSYYIKDEYKSLKEKRRDIEKEKQKKSEDINFPPYDTLKKESQEPEAFLLFTITDEKGNVVRKLKTNIKKGVNRIVWDFRYNAFTPVSTEPFDYSVPWNEPDKGYMAMPGKYTVTISKFADGKFTELTEPRAFNCKRLFNSNISEKDKIILEEFNKKAADLTIAVTSADAWRAELVNKIAYLKKAVLESNKVPIDTYSKVITTEFKLEDLNRRLNGDQLIGKYEGAVPTSIKQRIEIITSGLWSTTSVPTETFIQNFNTAKNNFNELSGSLKSIGDDIKQIELILDKYGAPYTPGRFEQ